MDEATRALQFRSSVWQRADWCHCSRPVATVTEYIYDELGPAAQALCEECLPLRCDAESGACDSVPPPRCLIGFDGCDCDARVTVHGHTWLPSFCECHDCYICGEVDCSGHPS